MSCLILTLSAQPPLLLSLREASVAVNPRFNFAPSSMFTLAALVAHFLTKPIGSCTRC